ncbi:MAG: LysM peptidoglycan-binding domain-containing protein [SAR324 cluster bacterium]|nr:LysM peptidoglycan-binding domain-containing protein [SAR324 cluster bacterium]
MSLWFHDHFGIGLSSLAFLWFGWHLIIATSFWVAARLAARIGHINTIVFAHIPSNLFLIALPFAPTAWVAITLWQVRSFFQLMDSPVRNSYIVGIVPSEERVAMSAYTSISQTGAAAITPTVAGAVWNIGSAAIPFISAGVIRVTYDILLWLMFHNLKTEEEKASAQVPGSEQMPAGPQPKEVPPTAEPPAGLEEAIGEETVLEAEEAPPLRSKPWIWAAAAAILVVIVALAIWLSLPGEEPVPPVALQPEPEATSAESAPAPQAAIVQPPPPGPAIRTIHTVRSGQSLWRISRRHYRRGVLWPEIFKVNQDQIDDPDLIFPKQEFKIPEVE